MNVQKMFADRIGGKSFGQEHQMYIFEKIKQAKRQAIEMNPSTQLIDLGVGEPDEMADSRVVQALTNEAGKIANRKYADNGCLEFKEAAADYMKQVYGVAGLDLVSEINHCIGSKSALAILPTAFINSGDLTIVTVPGYPILGTHTEWLGGEVVKLPLYANHNYFPDLNSLPNEVKKRAKLLYINYPNNPTGACATLEFYEKVVQFALENQIIVVSDEAYGALTFDKTKPLSFLNARGAKEVGVSIQSLSKAFNMTGWRLGFVAGNKNVIEAFASVKDHYDSGQFLAIQKAGAYCLKNTGFTDRTNDKYSRRHELLVKALNTIGFTAKKPKGSFFVYVEAPIGVAGGPTFNTAEEFSLFLLKKLLISTVPWDDAGRFVRFSVTYTAGEDDEEHVMNEIVERMSSVTFIW